MLMNALDLGPQMRRLSRRKQLKRRRTLPRKTQKLKRRLSKKWLPLRYVPYFISLAIPIEELV